MKLRVILLAPFALLALLLATYQAWAQGGPLGTAAGPNIYTLSVLTTATLAAVPANPTRRGYTICNNSANTVTFTVGSVTPVSASVGQQIAANTCFTVPPSGMGFVGNLGAAINMIASATSNVTVFEYF